MNDHNELPDSVRIVLLERRVAELERELETQLLVQRAETALLMSRLIELIIPSVRLSTAMAAGKAEDSENFMDQLFKRMDEVQKEINEFGGLDEQGN